MSSTDVAARPGPAARPGVVASAQARAGLLLLRGRTLVVLVLLIILFGTISSDYLTLEQPDR